MLDLESAGNKLRFRLDLSEHAISDKRGHIHQVDNVSTVAHLRVLIFKCLSELIASQIINETSND